MPGAVDDTHRCDPPCSYFLGAEMATSTLVGHRVHGRSSVAPASCLSSGFLIPSSSGEEESSVEERGWFSVLAVSKETVRLRPWERSGDREKGLGSV